MPFLIIMILALMGGAGWLANEWVVSHGVVVAINGQWSLVAAGWKAVGFLAGGFILVGLIFGVLLGFMAGSKIWSMFQSERDESNERTKLKLETERKALEASKIDLERRRWEFSGQTEGIALEARQKAQEQAYSALMGQKKAEKLAQHLEERLRNSQGKAKRLARKGNPIS
jgi:hypothetical protein